MVCLEVLLGLPPNNVCILLCCLILSSCMFKHWNGWWLSHHPWMCLITVWMWCSGTWFSEGLLVRVVWLGCSQTWSLRSFPTWAILWFLNISRESDSTTSLGPTWASLAQLEAVPWVRKYLQGFKSRFLAACCKFYPFFLSFLKHSLSASTLAFLQRKTSQLFFFFFHQFVLVKIVAQLQFRQRRSSWKWSLKFHWFTVSVQSLKFVLTLKTVCCSSKLWGGCCDVIWWSCRMKNYFSD